MRDRLIYIDNNASTRVRDEVLAAMIPYFVENWGNPSSSIHAMGRAAKRAVDESRGHLCDLLGCQPDEIVFTSGASEANALAIAGARPGREFPDRIVTADIEHKSVLSSCFMAEDRGIAMEMLPVGADGFVSAGALRGAAITPRTIVTVQWVNNETGAINPIEEIAAVVHERGALLHVDAAQATTKIDIDLVRIPIDLLTISAHKFYGPKGVGALIVRRGTTVEPMIRGGQQEHARRAGTENVPGIVGIGEAARLARHDSSSDRPRIADLRDRLEAGLLERCAGTILIRPKGERAGSTAIGAWEGLENREILRALDRAGICAASGSACTSDAEGPSRVLRAMRIPPAVAESAVRFSIGRYNTADEIEVVIDVVAETISLLRDAA